jgi:hypothetical protein
MEILKLSSANKIEHFADSTSDGFEKLPQTPS